MLEYLEVGKVHPALTPVVTKGGPDSTQDWLARCHITLGMVAVMSCAYKQEAAAKYVNRHIPDAVHTARKSRKGEPWRAIRGWHEQFTEHAVTNNIAQSNFSSFAPLIKATILHFPEDQRLAAATRFLRAISDRIVSDKVGAVSEELSD